MSNLADDPEAVRKMRQRGEREIYLYYEQRSRKQWAFDIARPQLEKMFFLILTLVLAVVIWVPFHFLGLDAPGGPNPVLLVGGSATVTTLAVMWHLEFRRPKSRLPALTKHALQLAGSRADGLHLYDGTVTDFVPAGAISMVHGRIAIGIDPQRQLMRHVSFDAENKAINVDWIFGMEDFREIAVVQEPVPGMTARILNWFGRPTPLRWVLRQSASGKTWSSHIDERHLLTAKELVRQLNYHRNNPDAATR